MDKIDALLDRLVGAYAPDTPKKQMIRSNILKQDASNPVNPKFLTELLLFLTMHLLCLMSFPISIMLQRYNECSIGNHRVNDIHPASYQNSS